MLQKSAVLRDVSRGTRTRSRAETAGAEPDIRVEVEAMSPGDRTDVSRDPEVVGVTPVMPTALIAPRAVPETEAAETAWGITAIGAEATGLTGAGSTVAVLDTGADSGHTAFVGVTLEERDFTGSGNGDVNGHGTHCAGTIFGRDVEDTRIGVARGVDRALIGKVLADDGSGSSEMIFAAIHWAATNGADVISMSLGFDFPGLVARLITQGFPADLATSIALEAYRGNLRVFDALMDLVEAQAAFSGGTVVVAAAGNESRREVNPDFEIAAGLPAAAERVISVGAVAEGASGFTMADFSNTLPVISGPGVNVLSARTGGGLRALSGTSMACPHVAGAAALMWEAVRADPVPASAENVAARLRAQARSDVFAAGVDVADRGVGLVNVA